MQTLLLWIGRLAGLLGAIVCAAAAIGRVMGTWSVGGFQVGTMLQGGMAAMLLGCLAYCATLAESPGK